jgi:hypothetical protein
MAVLGVTEHDADRSHLAAHQTSATRRVWHDELMPEPAGLPPFWAIEMPTDLRRRLSRLWGIEPTTDASRARFAEAARAPWFASPFSGLRLDDGR